MQRYRAMRFAVPSDSETGAEKWESMVSSGVPRLRDDGSIEFVGLTAFQRDLMPPELQRDATPKEKTAEGWSEESRIYRTPITRR